ncbi:hypothetical protein DPMN_046659 [Dreissena polymorpha]|uniref:Uncharacterized protein n=1 Tax=Dreissena polymorpha TaxID=45954 RepID=A0A9D4D784_DREPO|nr:hypothetical protein DPMN_046659 [Dreissena polymorpha]
MTTTYDTDMTEKTTYDTGTTETMTTTTNDTEKTTTIYDTYRKETTTKTYDTDNTKLTGEENPVERLERILHGIADVDISREAKNKRSEMKCLGCLI